MAASDFVKSIGAERVVATIRSYLKAEELDLVAAAWDLGELKIFSEPNTLTLISSTKVIKGKFLTTELEEAAIKIKPELETKLRALAARFFQE